MQSYEELKVWHRCYAFVLELYNLTRPFPPHEQYGLTSQLRRAAVSMPANLAEGVMRSTSADFARHVSIARGSASEVDCLLRLATDLGYLDEVVSQNLRRELVEIQRILTALRKSLERAG
jgi:four helix bundle protein